MLVHLGSEFAAAGEGVRAFGRGRVERFETRGVKLRRAEREGAPAGGTTQRSVENEYVETLSGSSVNTVAVLLVSGFDAPVGSIENKLRAWVCFAESRRGKFLGEPRLEAGFLCFTGCKRDFLAESFRSPFEFVVSVEHGQNFSTGCW